MVRHGRPMDVNSPAIEELADLLRPPHGPPQPQLLLDEGVEDVLAWLNDPRTFDGHHKRPWNSSINDVHATLALTAPHLRQALEPSIGDAERALSQLSPVLKGGPSSSDRMAARSATTALSQRLSDPAVVQAAWDDLVSGVRDPDKSPNEIMWRHWTFWGLVRTASISADEIKSLGRGIIDDDASAVAEAEIRLGERAELSTNEWDANHSDTILCEESRLDLIRRLLAARPLVGDQVIWICWTKATLDGPRVPFDARITFFDARWIREVFQEGSDLPNFRELPIELQNPAIFEPPMPEGEEVVFARIYLGHRASVGAVEDARRIMELVLDAADVSSGWHQMDGYLHAVDNVIRGFQGFTDPERSPSASYVSDLTGSRLQELASTLGGRLPAQPGSQLEQTLDAISWLRRARIEDPQAQILVGVRVVELVASWLEQWWLKFASENFKTAWATLQLRNQLYQALGAALSESVIRERARDEDRDDLIELGRRVMQVQSWPHVITHMDVGIREALPRLAGAYPPTSKPGRAVATATNDFMSGSVLASRIEGCLPSFDLLLGRLHRCRNAIAHGGPVPQATVRSIADFAQLLADSALQIALKGQLSHSEEVADTFSRFRSENDGAIDLLHQDASPASVLFTR